MADKTVQSSGESAGETQSPHDHDRLNGPRLFRSRILLGLSAAALLGWLLYLAYVAYQIHYSGG